MRGSIPRVVNHIVERPMREAYGFGSAGVDSVNTFPVGLGRTSAGLARTAYVFRLPSVSAARNAVRVPPWARFPSSEALFGPLSVGRTVFFRPAPWGVLPVFGSLLTLLGI